MNRTHSNLFSNNLVATLIFCFADVNVGDCNFDSPQWQQVCNWTQRQDDDIDWVQAASRTNPDTGPMADHQGTQNGREQVIGHNIIMCNIYIAKLNMNFI